MTKKCSCEKQELEYSPVERVGRWNICQSLAKFIYESGLDNDELIRILEGITQYNQKLIINIQ